MSTDLDDHGWLLRAVALSRLSPPSTSAHSVGAVIVDATGTELASGYSRDTDVTVHAEESALARLDRHDPWVADATLYTTLEPCTERQSRPTTCTQLVLAAGLRRVVYAYREPALFVANSRAWRCSPRTV